MSDEAKVYLPWDPMMPLSGRTFGIGRNSTFPLQVDSLRIRALSREFFAHPPLEMEFDLQTIGGRVQNLLANSPISNELRSV